MSSSSPQLMIKIAKLYIDYPEGGAVLDRPFVREADMQRRNKVETEYNKEGSTNVYDNDAVGLHDW
jgi:hypothetical protein